MPIKNKNSVFISRCTVNSWYSLIFILMCEDQSKYYQALNFNFTGIKFQHICGSRAVKQVKCCIFSLIILLHESNFGCQLCRTRKLKVLYWKTLSINPQMKYGTQPNDTGTDNLYSRAKNIKEMM